MNDRGNRPPWKGCWKKRASQAEPIHGRENYFANLAAAMPDDVKLAFAELAGIMRLDTERKTIRRVG